MLEIRAGKSGVNLQSSRVYSSPVMVSGDRERITQVLTNLVVNSFKYGVENGTTEIEVEALNAAKILVRVIDNGKGIAEEHLPRLV